VVAGLARATGCYLLAATMSRRQQLSVILRPDSTRSGQAWLNTAPPVTRSARREAWGGVFGSRAGSWT